jgi:hypothetical protein
MQVTKDVNIGHILEPSCEFHSPRPGYIRIKRDIRDYDEVPLLSSGLPLECRVRDAHHYQYFVFSILIGKTKAYNICLWDSLVIFLQKP